MYFVFSISKSIRLHICIISIKFFRWKFASVISMFLFHKIRRFDVTGLIRGNFAVYPKFLTVVFSVRTHPSPFPHLSCLFICQKWISRANKCRIELRVIGLAYQSTGTSAITRIFHNRRPWRRDENAERYD